MFAGKRRVLTLDSPTRISSPNWRLHGDPFGALRLLRAGSSLRLKNGFDQDDATREELALRFSNCSTN